MIIDSFIRREYQTVNAFEGVDMIRKELYKQGALVVMLHEEPVGVLTPNDLVLNPRNLVIDCLTPKSVVKPHTPIEEVIGMMKSTQAKVLPVYDEEGLTGLLYFTDLLEYLYQTAEMQRSVVHAVAHDLKTPLANISGLTSLLKDNLTAEHDRKLATYAEETCLYATEVVNELLYAAELEAGKEDHDLILTELNSFLEEGIQFITRMASVKQIRVESHIPAEKYFIAADHTKLRRVIHNLLTNAVKFTPDSGHIHVSLSSTEEEVLITVKDNGIGIPPNLQSAVFDKFTRAKRSGTSGEATTGLGMYITKRIIEQHRGRVWFDSAVNAGTTFYAGFKKV